MVRHLCIVTRESERKAVGREKWGGVVRSCNATLWVNRLKQTD